MPQNRFVLLYTLMAAVCLSTTPIFGEDSEPIYKSTDENGIPVFSDHASGNAKKVKVQDPYIFEGKNLTAKSTTVKQDKTTNSSNAAYRFLSIVEPESGSVIRENSGALNFRFKVEPQPTSEHVLQLVMDGKAIKDISGLTASLTSVDRGEHHFHLQVVSRKTGKLIQKGPPSTINLLRFSIQHRRPGS